MLNCVRIAHFTLAFPAKDAGKVDMWPREKELLQVT